MKYLYILLGLECNTSPHKPIGPFNERKIKTHRDSYKLIAAAGGPLPDLFFYWHPLVTLILQGNWGLFAKPCTKAGARSSRCDSSDGPMSGSSTCWGSGGRSSGGGAGEKRAAVKTHNEGEWLVLSQSGSPPVQLWLSGVFRWFTRLESSILKKNFIVSKVYCFQGQYVFAWQPSAAPKMFARCWNKHKLSAIAHSRAAKT